MIQIECPITYPEIILRVLLTLTWKGHNVVLELANSKNLPPLAFKSSTARLPCLNAIFFRQLVHSFLDGKNWPPFKVVVSSIVLVSRSYSKRQIIVPRFVILSFT